MNQKQKLGYMALGAGILALGIIIGQIITPGIEAQSNGVFDKIQCRELEVVDEQGEVAIVLQSYKGKNTVMVLGKTGGLVALDTSDEQNGVLIFGKEDQHPPAVRLYHHKEMGNGMLIQNKHGKRAILLRSDDDGNDVSLYDNPQGKKRAVWLKCDESGNALFLEGQAGEESMGLLAVEKSNPFIMIKDRAGKHIWSTPSF